MSEVFVGVVFHSASGRTRALAEAVARGARDIEGATAITFDVTTTDARALGDELARADAIIFGCPTYMGGVSAQFKSFMDASAAVWALQGWRDKIGAGFTHSSAPSGDKLATLTALATFAAQHGMIWAGLGLPPSYASAARSDDARAANAVNRLGSHLGAMAQTPPGASAHEGDIATAAHLGRRVANLARAFRAGQRELDGARSDEPEHSRDTLNDIEAHHPTTHAWSFPPHDRPEIPGFHRTNLRTLAARPERLEHHLTVVARIGDAQLEIATASEPLYFAHVNISDEYAVALPTGDALVDGFPLRTFLSDATSGADVGRYNHRAGDLVLHPQGTLHWPGKLRPPYEPFAIPKGMRRTGVSLVFCAGKSHAPATGQPIFVTRDREADSKAYVENAPKMLLADLFREDAREVARVASARLDLVVAPKDITLAHGGYVVVLETDDRKSMHHACDLVHLPPGISLDCAGISRALVFTSDTTLADPPPSSWTEVPGAPFPIFEHGKILTGDALPFSEHGLHVEAESSDVVRVTVNGATTLVPRHWLARMLFRVGLHGLALGHVETYGGLFVADLGDPVRVGIRGGDPIAVPRSAALAFIERLYRAVAPPGYEERLDS